MALSACFGFPMSLADAGAALGLEKAAGALLYGEA